MQLLIKAGIVVLGFLFCSTVIYAEKEDRRFGSPRQALKFSDNAIRLDPGFAAAY